MDPERGTSTAPATLGHRPVAVAGRGSTSLAPPGRIVDPWWLPGAAFGVIVAVAFVLVNARAAWPAGPPTGSGSWWLLTAVSHVPFMAILVFLAAGICERVGYFWRGRAPTMPGRLPALVPSVCVQLPMFNEHAVAERAISAACRLRWPGRLSVQVLDDSTDPDTRRLVDEVCRRLRAETGVDCRVLRRDDRRGYKAGALEAGRRSTGADYLAIFDADFLPGRDFLLRAIPYFYGQDGRLVADLALVQARWSHLNEDESALTRAQALWIDDHHTVQMSWRSARWQFVNFTGTAGVWRADAVAAVGGWRSASLVEDCELSFRHLFAGYRTAFVKEIAAPAELPATFTAYKAQQRRWTQGWVQLQKLHLGTLLFRHPATRAKRLHLTYHMCISWQWPAWGLWMVTFPFAISSGLWFGALGVAAGLLAYAVPVLAWTALVAAVAAWETPAAGGQRAMFWRRLRRVVPFAIVSTGMLAHQCCAFLEGLFGPLHGEFERTPKAGTQRSTRAYAVRIHRPYVVAELLMVAYQVAWAAAFLRAGLLWCAAGSAAVAACVLYVTYHYGDHAGRVCGVVPRHRRRFAPSPPAVGAGAAEPQQARDAIVACATPIMTSSVEHAGRI